jgi:uncharacterized protein YerC
MNEQKFWQTLKVAESGCWEWTGAVGSSGYGSVSYKSVNFPAHRLAWILARGKIPNGPGYHGTIVAHRCDNRICCNPDHLFLTDASGNQVDALHKGRASAAKLTVQQVKEIVASLSDGATAKELSEKYGVTRQTIAAVVKRRSWSSITKDAGELRFAPREIDPLKWRKADYKKIKSLLASGKTLRQIARECDTTHTTVRRVMNQERIGASTPFERMNEVDRERIHDLARSGASQSQISNWLGRSQASVSRVLTSTKAA